MSGEVAVAASTLMVMEEQEAPEEVVVEVAIHPILLVKVELVV